MLAIAPGDALAFKVFGYGFFEPDAEPVSPDSQPYSIDVAVDTQDTDLADRLKEASQLYVDRDQKAPASTPAFLSRAHAEYDRLLASLYANGYYGGTIAITVAGRPLETLSPDARLPRPVPVTIAVTPGPLFRFGSVVIKGRAPAAREPADRIKATPEKLGLVSGEPARSEIVIQSQSALVDEWRQDGYPKARATSPAIVANHKTDRLDVDIGVASGPAAVYGPVSVTGTDRMDPGFVAWISGLVPGQPYDPDDNERALKRLRRLQVFNATSLVEAASVTPAGTLPMTIAVAERPLHVFGAGGSYSTEDGLGVEGYWEHRNLFGRAERLRFEARMSGVDGTDPRNFTYLAGATFVKPGVWDPVTDLTAGLTASREVYDPYSQNTFRARVGLAHEFFEGLNGTVAVNGEVDRVDDSFGSRTLVLASLPAGLAYDGTDDKLEPTRGFRARLDVEPFHEFEYGNTGLATKLQGSTYVALDANARYVVAARAAVGSIVGAPADEMPADRLFFAGGGGSVRGYAYRSIGPRIDDHDVVGGLSLVEASLEFRARVTDTIGIVPFVDAGSAFVSSLPDFSETIKVGAGIGLRYYTGLGAIRADIAVPVNPDPGDSAFAFYIGLGESF